MENPTIDYSRHYRNWHSDDEQHINKLIKYYATKIKPLLPGDKAIRVLDIGCGMGFFLLMLRKEGFSNIMGIDTDALQIQSCRNKQLEVFQVDDTPSYLKQNVNQFDIITAFDVLEHIASEAQISFIQAVFGALKENGKFILTTPNANSFLASRNRYIDYTHQVLFTEVSLDFVLFNGGFKKIEVRPMEYVSFQWGIKSILHWILWRIFRFFRRLEFMAELGNSWGRKVPLSFNLIAIATKD